MIPKSSVVKTLDILVCLNPDATTSKLKTARAYGTLVISQTLFLALTGTVAAGDGEVAALLELIAGRAGG